MGFTLCDREAGVVHATPTALRLLGHVPKSASKSEDPLETLRLEEWPLFDVLVVNTVSTDGRKSENETRIDNGTPFGQWVLTASEVLSYDQTQKPTLIASIHLDITDRKMREESERGYARYKSLVNDAPLGVFITPARKPREILYMNDEMARLLQVSTTTGENPSRVVLRGTDYFRFLQEESKAKELDYLRSIPPQQRRKEPMTLVGLAGGFIDVAVTTISGQWEGEDALLFFVEDITSLNREKRSLEKVNGELREFTYTVSHDLQSPLITIRSFLAKMAPEAETLNSPTFRRRLERVQLSARRMQNLVKDLLELSRIGRIEQATEVITLSREIERVRETIRGRIETTGASVNIFRQTLPRILGIRSRIGQLYQNLLENSLKFARPGVNPRVDVAAEKRNQKWIFYVEDNGVGIAADHRERIFGAFNKLDTNSEGTGIGLALVKKIVETHGGSVWVEEPKQGPGSRICFTFSDDRILGD